MVIAIRKLFRWLVLALFLSCLPLIAVSRSICVDIVVSWKIRPYIVMANAMSDHLNVSSRLFVIDDENHTLKLLESRSCKVVVAVGHRAFLLVSRLKRKCIKIYSMVLYPWEEPSYGEYLCGTSLDISGDYLALALNAIEAKRPCLLFFDRRLSRYVNGISNHLKKKGFFPVVVRGRNPADIDEVIKKIGNRVDSVFFVPDPALSAEDLIRQLTEVFMVRGKKVIGFNKIFLEEGAHAALIMDYEATGKVTASAVKEAIARGFCRSSFAVYKVITGETGVGK